MNPRGLLLASHALAAASEQAGNMRCWRFANDVSNAATQSAARFPSACPDAEMADGVRVLAAQLRQLAFGSGAPVNPSNASLGKPLQAVKAAVVGVEGAAGALAACGARSASVVSQLRSCPRRSPREVPDAAPRRSSTRQCARRRSEANKADIETREELWLMVRQEDDSGQ